MKDAALCIIASDISKCHGARRYAFSKSSHSPQSYQQSQSTFHKMSVPNPLLFLVTGAWHQQAHYQAFATQLAKIGLTLHVTVYKSVILDPDQPTDPTAQDDTDAIRAQLVAQLDAQPERDIVVLTHSYGGVPGGGAAHGLNKAERVKEGKTNGVIGLVYLTALAIAKGESVWVNSVFADASPEEKGDSVGSLQMNKV